MHKNPRVALFIPSADSHAEISAVFKRHDYQIRYVNTIEQTVDTQDQENQPFDSIVVPLRLDGGSSGVGLCLQIKARPELIGTPLVALCPTTDKETLQTFFEMGADAVVTSPFDPERVFLQIGALARQAELFRAENNRARRQTLHLSHFEQVFGSFPEALLLCTPSAKIIFGNTLARSLLYVPKVPDSLENFAQIHAQVRQHLNRQQKLSSFEFQSPNPTLKAVNFEGQIYSLSKDNLLIRFIEISEYAVLANQFLQQSYMRTLSLLSVASAFNLGRGKLAKANSFFLSLENYANQQSTEVNIAAALSELIEALDVIIPNSISVKLDVRHNEILNLSFIDFFRISGELLLYACDFCMGSGQIILETNETGSPDQIALTLTAKTQSLDALNRSPLLGKLRQLGLSQEPTQSTKMLAGLNAAQKIAVRYGSNVEFQNSEPDLLKLRIKLPSAHREN